MSNKNTDNSRKRTYSQRVRARRRQEVHRRITLAAVYLHGSIGPARTTISDIATRAGVRRATVYNHFPTDLELIDACSSHWFGENPPPNPADWAAIPDPAQRIKVALEALYQYYNSGREMLEKVLRDTPQVPALQKILRLKWWPLLEKMVEILAQGWEHTGRERGKPGRIDGPGPALQSKANPEIRASIRVALDFFTWQTLAESGLSNRQAARLAAAWIDVGINKFGGF